MGLGTVSLGVDYGIPAPGEFGRPADADAIAVLVDAAAAGVTFFDTAPAYGAAEERVGRALGHRSESFLATKVAIPPPGTSRARAAAVRASLAESRRRLRRTALDLVQIHNADRGTFADADLMDALDAARREGSVRAVGASVYGEDAAFAAIESGRVQVLQVAYNLVDQRMASEVFPLARRRGVGVVVRSVLLKGALTPKARHLPASLAALRDGVESACAELGIGLEDLPEYAVRFALSHPDVSTVLMGARTVGELKVALKACEAGPLPPGEAARAATVGMDDRRIVDPSTWEL